MTLIKSNLRYLSRRTYSQRLMFLLNELDRRPSEIKKQSVLSFLNDLNRNAHHIYVLLEHLQFGLFYIERYHRHGEIPTYDWGLNESSDLYSLKDFLTNYDQFHDKDFFRVSFRLESFYFKIELSRSLFIPYYEDFLASRCERRLRNNDPIVLTPEVCAEYGLTAKDTKKVNLYLTQYSEKIINQMQLEYDHLKEMNCIKK